MYAECSSHAIPERDGGAPVIGGRYRIGIKGSTTLQIKKVNNILSS